VLCGVLMSTDAAAVCCVACWRVQMQQRLDEFVRLAQLCHDPSASLTYRQLGQLKQPKSLRRKRHGELICLLLSATTACDLQQHNISS